jgi:hypothetical protein
MIFMSHLDIDWRLSSTALSISFPQSLDTTRMTELETTRKCLQPLNPGGGKIHISGMCGTYRHRRDNPR